MWKLAALIAVAALACLAPFTALGLLIGWPALVASLADRFCRG